MDINSIEKMYLNNGYVVLRDFLPKKVLEKFKISLSGHISNQLSKHGLENFNDPLNEGLIELNKIRIDKTKLDSVQIIYNTIRKLPELFELITNEDLIRVKSILDAGVNLIVIDTAHGHSEKVLKILSKIKKIVSKIRTFIG